MMINYYFKVVFCLIKWSFLFLSIYIFGFVWGMVVVFFIYLWVIDEFIFEDYNLDVGRIFRVIEVNCFESGEVIENFYILKFLVDVFCKEFLQVEEVIYFGNVDMIFLRLGDKFLLFNWMCVDMVFFDVFYFFVVEGDFGRLKLGFNYIVLFEMLVKKFFGNELVVGKEVMYNRGMDGELVLRIVGVVKVFCKSYIQFDVIVGQFFFDKIDVNIVWMFFFWDVWDVMVYVKMCFGIFVFDFDWVWMSCILSKYIFMECLFCF